MRRALQEQHEATLSAIDIALEDYERNARILKERMRREVRRYYAQKHGN